MKSTALKPNTSNGNTPGGVTSSEPAEAVRQAGVIEQNRTAIDGNWAELDRLDQQLQALETLMRGLQVARANARPAGATSAAHSSVAE